MGSPFVASIVFLVIFLTLKLHPDTLFTMELRNVAIIAHVDHGKTTLVDAILRQTGVFRANEVVQECVLDSNAIERERGITILAKNTGVFHKGVKINIVDTPGHADFGGEVQRILGMVDGALLIVDAAEGPLPQTRYVLQNALQQHLRPVVVINKIDRSDARADEVVDEVLDLFISLGADDDQLEFPLLYASARAGVAHPNLETALAKLAAKEADIHPLLDTILEAVPPPAGQIDHPLQAMVTMLDYDDYVGRVAIGRITGGVMNQGMMVAVGRAGQPYRQAKLTNLYTFERLKRVATASAGVGEIVAITGINEIEIGDTIMDTDDPRPLPPLHVDAPTLSVTFRVNDSPLAGQDGIYVTSRHISERLQKEARSDVALSVEPGETPDVFHVSGRGELHLGILMETMRREGYEFCVSKPQVIMQEVNGELYEPLEYLSIDVPQEYTGVVMERLGVRKGELVNMTPLPSGNVKIEFVVPARGLVGFSSELLTETKGNGLMHHTFHGYGPHRGEVPMRQNGSLVAWESGTVTAYALENAQERGILFVSPGDVVYEGMIVGTCNRTQDLDINVCKKKHVTNMRASTSDIAVKLDPTRTFTLEQALAYLNEDEWLEVTKTHLRLRKAVLSRNARAK
jgi:GTP-binding protein